MNIAGKSLQLLVGVPFLMMALCDVSHGQQLPENFHGVWIISVAEDSSCKRSDWDNFQNDALLKVEGREAQFFASTCNVKSVKPSPSDAGSTVELTLACSGEGEVRNTREIWSVRDIGPRKALVMTQLQASQSVSAESRRTNKMRPDVDVSLYLACQ